MYNYIIYIKMLTLKFKESTKPKGDLALDNLRTISNHPNITLCVNAAMAWWKYNPGMKTTDLENKLREENIDIHLISSSQDYDKTKYRLSLPFDPESSGNRLLILSARPKEYAMKELLEHASSYEENFSRLNEAGMMTPVGLKFSELENKLETDMDKLKDVYGELEVSVTPLDEAFNNAFEEYKQKYNKEPELAVHSMSPNGSFNMTLVHEGKVICGVGLNVTYNEAGEKVVSYVPL
jgi:hypothetical protein